VIRGVIAPELGISFGPNHCKTTKENDNGDRKTRESRFRNFTFIGIDATE
jgi:hypothetical protein